MKKRYLGLLALATILTSGLAVVNEHGFEKVDAEEVTATLSFASKTASRTSFSKEEQVWEQNGITFKNIRNGAKSPVADYENPVRLYKGSKVVINTEKNISKIVFTCSATKYSIAGSITPNAANEQVTTVSLDGNSNSYTVESLAQAVRLTKIDVTYYSEGGNTDPETPVEPEPEQPEVQDPTPDTTLSIVDAVALGSSKEHNTYTSGKYYVTGTVESVYNTEFGNMYIKDENGNKLQVYGSYSADGSARYDAMTDKPVAGDTVTLYGIIGQYNGTAQMKNGWVTSLQHPNYYDGAKSLFTKYYNNGSYTKNTSINVKPITTLEIKSVFHAGVSYLTRTTTYTSDSLTMTSKESSGYSSKYQTIGNKMYHYSGSSTNSDYFVDNTTVEDYYVTLNDFVNGVNKSSYATDTNKDLTQGWSYANGVYTSTNANVINAFRLFTAPLWLDTDAAKNYIQFEKATVEEVNNTLVMKLYASSTNSGLLTDANNVFSVAYIEKSGHSYHVYSAPVKTSEEQHTQTCLFCTDAKSGDHTGGTATTTEQATCSQCGGKYGELATEEPTLVEKTYTHTFAASQIKQAAGTIKLNNVSWTQTAATFIGFDQNDRGVQIGSSNKPTSSFVLSTEAFSSNKIKKIVVNATSGGSATLTIKIGDKAVLDSQKLTSTATDYVATVSELTGEVSITLAASSKAMYIKSITIIYLADE